MHGRGAGKGGGATGEPREPEVPPPTGHASRGPRPAPVRHAALARRPGLGPSGRCLRPGAQRALGAARTRRMPQPGPSERQVRRGAAPGAPGPPQARWPGGVLQVPWPFPPHFGDKGCGGSSCPRPSTPKPAQVGGGSGSPRGLGDCETRPAGRAALRRVPWGFHLPRGGNSRGVWVLRSVATHTSGG